MAVTAREIVNFRPDINGLRAFAVLGVLVFHFVGDMLPGGFAGVDVFFVISGFLMTSIIFRGLEKGSFSIRSFYMARAKRIVPALTVLCITLVAMGWFYLHPFDFGTLGKHILGSLTFISNFLYVKESGYFDEASREKWLLHTWSLSVEWQFYLVYPVVLVLLGKIFRVSQMRWILIFGAAISFVLCIYGSERWPSSSFYLLPTRAWEMLAGGLAYSYPFTLSKTAKKFAEVIGISIILIAYLSLSEAAAWPGYLALIPVFGAVLVIAANREESWITGNAACQWMGKSSYSIYLWHWPLVVWLNYSGKGSNTLSVIGAVIASFGLGALSYSLIENRKLFTGIGKLLALPFGANLGWLYAISVGLSLAVFYEDGFTNRLSTQYKELTKNQIMPRRENGYCFVDFNNDSHLVASESGLHCPLGDQIKPRTVLLFGDSFAGHYEPFWDVIGKANGMGINAITTNWCMPVESTEFDGPISNAAFKQCQLNRKYLFENMEKYDVLVLAGMWSNSLERGYLDQVKATIRQAAKRVHTVIIMPAPMRYDTNILKRYQSSQFSEIPFDISLYSTTKDREAMRAYDFLRESTKDLSNVVFIERSQLFSASGLYEKSGRLIPYSLDGMHITLEGSLRSAETFMESDIYKINLLPKKM